MLFSLHLKATMMKVSDPIMFGHCVRVFFEDVFTKHADLFEELGVDPNNGFGDVLAKIAGLPEDQRAAIEADIQAAFENGPGIAMVDSDRGITNLHVPSDIIIDASMPPMIRDSGRMWNAEGKLQDCKAVIPDSSYAGIYDAMVRDCPGPRPVRSDHHGKRAQRGPHGPEGRGVRLPRQDLRDPGRRHRPGGGRRREHPHGAQRWRRATSGGPARPRTPPFATG